MSSNANKHLTLDERKIIETGIKNGSSKVAIAKTIGKDNSTIGKEIKLNRELKARNSFVSTIDCAKLKKCSKKPCKGKCSEYEAIKCKRRDRSPGACNGCSKKQCRLDKYYYTAEKAHKHYLETLVDSREGINMTDAEVKVLGDTLKPLIDKGQSVYQILSAHPEIEVCEKTIYNYIGNGVFAENGIINLDLRTKVKRKAFKKVKTKKRQDNSYLQGRKYVDFEQFMKDNPNTPYVEMDTVYNEIGGPYIQTFIFVNYSFMIGILHQEKTAETMLAGIELLYTLLGDELFRKLFPLILTDRGTEFAACEQMEINENGELRTRIFYCDPMQSSQKPHVENNHHYIRYILPKEITLQGMTQEKLDLMFSHINSTPREKLNGKTPYEMMEFIYGEKVISSLKITKIDRDDVVLKPYLLKNK